VSVYLDASVLVPLFADDPFSERVSSYLRLNPSAIVVSDFAAGEFASAIARRVRIGLLRRKEARAGFATFDSWASDSCELVPAASRDVLAATTYLRRLDLNLRLPDAVNIAMSLRLDAELATFDRATAGCARAPGAKLAPL
jgi:predicted nucleic acid-binding protein